MYGRPNMMAVVMAGGRGTRLHPLTIDRAKPAVPFGGIYRIIDFALSNCIHSGLRHVLVATQYKSDSLSRHIEVTWNFFTPGLGGFIHCSPPQQRDVERWYAGTADCVYQNLFRVRDVNPRHVLILAGDHIYKANYRKLLAFHEERDADVTIAALPVPVDEAAGRFGVIVADADGRVTGFEEKPARPTPMATDPSRCLASMGIYIFRSRQLYRELEEGPGQECRYDFGGDIVPAMVEGGRTVVAWPFADENDKAAPYWRDVGTLDAYYDANVDLVRADPDLNLYDMDWPIHGWSRTWLPPAKFVHEWRDGVRHQRIGRAHDSLVAAGVVVSGGTVRRSILAPEVRVNSYSLVEDAIVLDRVDVGRNAKLRHCVVDKQVRIPPGERIGFDLEHDRQRFTVTESGLVVVPKGFRF